MRLSEQPDCRMRMTVLADEAFILKLKGPVELLTFLAAATTVASLVAYLRIWLRHMTVDETPRSK